MARILVIDDDTQLRTLLVRVLQQAGHEVADADNGRRGLALVAEYGPELVVTDIVMPEQEGLETIQALRRDHPGLPIIAMSGGAAYGSGAYLQMAGKLGAAATLRKPFDPEDLVAAIEAVLPGVQA